MFEELSIECKPIDQTCSRKMKRPPPCLVMPELECSTRPAKYRRLACAARHASEPAPRAASMASWRCAGEREADEALLEHIGGVVRAPV